MVSDEEVIVAVFRRVKSGLFEVETRDRRVHV
jgi:hypothetical protein